MIVDNVVKFLLFIGIVMLWVIYIEGFVWIVVVDYGIGVVEEVLFCIFDVYY